MTASVTVAADGRFTYTPAGNFFGTDTFTYTVSDGTTADTATVTVAEVNDAPVAVPDGPYVVSEDPAGPLVVTAARGLLANDADPDLSDGIAGNDGTLTAGAGTFATARGGSVTVAADGSFTYLPAPNFSGTDSFTYALNDGRGATAAGRATVAVTAASDPPVANDDSSSGTEDTPVTGDVLANDTDPDGAGLTVADAGTRATARGGSVTVAADGRFTYTPAGNFFGTDTFTYTVSDGNGGADTATVTVTVTPVNDTPVANEDAFAGAEDVPITGGVLANDADPDNLAPPANAGLTVTTASPITTARGGTVTIAPNGNFTYTPPADFNGTDTFTYTVSDGTTTDTAAVTLTVAPVDDAPTAANDAATVAEDAGATAIHVLGNDSFAPDAGETLAIAAVTQGANGTVAITGGGTGLTYTPAPNFFSTDTFTYTISDGTATATAAVTVAVTPVNDPPTVNNDRATVSEDATATAVNVLANDALAPDHGEVLTITSVTPGGNGGTVVITGGGGPG